ncbi:hypothetical protein M2142_002219 [Fusobacterium sp. PH5-29]|uniref:toxin-antitoxin system YwqK family antitoxin n=1 Tax=Fusobacterium sp. PH5-29 TaxID=1742400 RepID=UPI003D21E73C
MFPKEENKPQKYGEYTIFYEDGTLKEKGSYINGQKNGNFITYYPNGELKSKVNYINNQINSKYKEFYSNDFPKEVSMMNITHSNQLISHTILYDEKNHAKKEIFYYTIRSNSYRIESFHSAKTKYIVSGIYSGNKISPIIYYLNNKFDSDKFMIIQEYLFLMFIPFLIIAFTINFYRKNM